jgi:hypothetical protein
VQEVVARYCTALLSAEPPSGTPDRNFLAHLVRTAAALGDFYRTWQQHGWDAALARLGVKPASPQAGDDVIPDLLDKLAGPGARLEEAVSRAALIDHLVPLLSVGKSPDPPAAASGSAAPEAAARVCHFLGLALYRKLLSDLGETLEFHARTITRGIACQEELKSHMVAALTALPATAPSPEALSLPTLLERSLASLGGRREL